MPITFGAGVQLGGGIQIGGVASAAGSPIVFSQLLDGAVAGALNSITIPATVDSSYVAIWSEIAQPTVTTSLPAGWTYAIAPFVGAASYQYAMSYKILSTADRGLALAGALTGTGNNREQLYLFRRSDGQAITSVTVGNTATDIAIAIGTSTLTANAPVITSTQSAVCIHFYYDSSNATQTLASTPTMTTNRNSLNAYQGTQYITYAPSSTPLNQSASATRTVAAAGAGYMLSWFTIS